MPSGCRTTSRCRRRRGGAGRWRHLRPVNDAAQGIGAAIAIAGSLLASSYRTHLGATTATLPTQVRGGATDSLSKAVHRTVIATIPLTLWAPAYHSHIA
ncbi:hypothetical protein SAMN05216266_14214 [Amycolatopsis marina]|uniref:Uncharacterized protein n=2 Tax=Amycolatopsis TaxID=1813 RepID=A0A1I1CNN0_9PSEU|nr:hypothetical protein [Amycolatopsis marina]MBE1579562.1 hypothetical protein [Amycolatopsis roodepoortensis]TWE15017.1 hypothetical protein FHX69_7191 [Prauserella muralis]SFB64315.1 hypothetical protein SAMN05216266_14214 [Amycolatopsis marina]